MDDSSGGHPPQAEQQLHQQLHQHPPPPPPLQTWAALEAELAMDASRRDALVHAVVSGDLATVTQLIKGDHALVFHTRNRKTSLLVLAAQHDRTDVAAYLLGKGLDPNKASQLQQSPLHAAARLPVRIGKGRN